MKGLSDIVDVLFDICKPVMHSFNIKDIIKENISKTNIKKLTEKKLASHS